MQAHATASPFSPIAVAGTIAMLVAYVLCAWSAAAGIAGNARKSRRLVISSVYALYAFGALIAVASALIIYAFVTHDYAIRYVFETSDTSMPVWYKVTSFWGSLEGSLLFWVLMLALFSMVAVAVNYRKHKDMIGYVVGTIMLVQVFFMTLLVFQKNPFATFLSDVPTDGKGLNPLLQNYWMVIHPPALYIGFVAATIPFAFGIAALASGRLDDLWLSSVRTWMLICFFFLSLGLILGGRWAYEELGWGGYWAWDPVENAGFIPWFTATAFLHSIIIQEQRGMMKGWNMVLMFLTFFFTIWGTFMTRSGIVQSVHAFGEDKLLALQFVIFMGLLTIIAVGLIVYRWQRLSSTGRFESFTSREFSFLLNNWILLACALFILFATMFPTIKETLLNERATVGIGFYNKAMPWGGLSLLFLLGAAPLLAWRRTTRERLLSQFLRPGLFALGLTLLLLAVVPATRKLTTLTFYAFDVDLPIPAVTLLLIFFGVASIGQEFWRGIAVRTQQTGSDPVSSLFGLLLTKRRKYGGYIVHLGMAVLFCGFVGKAYDRMVDRTIAAPISARATTGPVADNDPAWFAFQGYRFLYEELTQTSDDRKQATTARVSVWKDGKKLATVFPAQWQFFKGSQPTTEVAILPRVWLGGETWSQRADFSEDVYLVLTGFNGEQANFRIYLNPLVNFVWLGFLILALGTIICLLPEIPVPAPRTRLGRAAEAATLVLLALGIVAGLTKAAVAESQGAGATSTGAQPAAGSPATAGPQAEQAPRSLADVPAAVLAQAGGEHDTGQGMGDGQGYAHLHRPSDDTTAWIMKELICMCGGCQRETIFECKCAFAAEERKKVIDRISAYSVATPSEREHAKKALLASFVKEYGSEQVLATPASKSSWFIPVLGALGGLGILLVVARKWVVRGKQEFAQDKPAAQEDAAYAERLDDELAKVD